MPASFQDVLQSAEATIAGLGAPLSMRALLEYPLRKADQQLKRNPTWPVLHLPGVLTKAYGLSESVATDLGVACLLLYGFADLTDDAQDGDLQGDWGWERAVNAGNALAFLGSEVIGRLAVSPEIRARLALEFVTAGRKMTFGQEADLLASYPRMPSIDEYMTLVARKSGASVAFFATVAAMAAGAGDHDLRHLHRFGESLGTYLQVLSDAADLSAIDSSDLRNRKVTLPLIYGFSRGGSIAETLTRMLEGAGSPEALNEALTQAGAMAYCRMKAQLHKRAAETALEALPLTAETKAQLHAHVEAPLSAPSLDI